MSMFEKIKLRNKEAFETHLSDDFIGRSIAHNTTYNKEGVLEYEAISKPESYELLLETDTKLVCQGVDVTAEGRFPVIDVWTHDGNKITSCDFLFGQMGEE